MDYSLWTAGLVLWIIPVLWLCYSSPYREDLDIWPQVSKLCLNSGCLKLTARNLHSSLLSLLVIYWSRCFVSSTLRSLSILAHFNPRASCWSSAALPCPYNKHGVLGFNTLSHIVRNSKLPLRRRIKQNLAVQDVGRRRHWWSKWTWVSKWFISQINLIFLFFFLQPGKLEGTLKPEDLLEAELTSDTTQTREKTQMWMTWRGKRSEKE